MYLRTGARVYVPSGAKHAGMATVRQVLGDTAEVIFDSSEQSEWISTDLIDRVELYESRLGIHRNQGSRGRRTSRNPPPQLYRAVGVDSSGHRHPIGAGPVSAMRETAMAQWLGDPSMRSAYVLDQRGHSHLSLEPRDRQRLRANRTFDGDGIDHDLYEPVNSWENDIEGELSAGWIAVQSGDRWKVGDALAHLDLLQDYASPTQRTEIRSLRSALKQMAPNGRGMLHANKLSEMEIWNSVATVRQSGHPTAMASMLPPGVAAKFRKLAPGLYKYGYGPKRGEAIVKFSKASLLGAMTSTRIGASKVSESHWLVDNFDPKFPVIIRGIDDHGRTYFRVEEYAKTLAGKREHVPVSRKRTTSKSAKR